MALAAPVTTAATTAEAPRLGPPSTITGPAPSRCGQGCILHSSRRCVHRSTPYLLHRCTTGLPVAPPSCPCRCLHRTSSSPWPLPGRPGRARGINSLANSFRTMALTPPAVTDWVADSGASNHTTSDAGNLSSVHPPTSTDPSSIVVGNGSVLPVTSVGDSAIPGPFYLNNVLVTPDIIQNLLSVRRFTTDN
jgi:hypothetical protein